MGDAETRYSIPGVPGEDVEVEERKQQETSPALAIEPSADIYCDQTMMLL